MTKFVLNLFFYLTSSSFIFCQVSLKQQCDEEIFPAYSPEKKQYGYKNLFDFWRVQPFFTKAYPFHGKVAVVIKGKYYGVINCEGRIIVDPIYDEIKQFKNGVAWVRKKDKWGLVNEKGDNLLMPEYSEVKNNTGFMYTAWLRKENKWALYSYDSLAFKTKFVYDDIKTLMDSTALVRSNEKIGIVSNQSGQVKIPLEIDKVIKVAPFRIAYKKGKHWGLFHESGEILTKPIFDTIYPSVKYRLTVKKDKKYGLINLRGKYVVPPKFEEIGSFSQNVAPIRFNGKYGYVHSSGKLVIPFKYNEAQGFQNFKAIVKDDDNYGIIDARGNYILAPKWDNIELNYSNMFFVASRSDTSWFITKRGKIHDEICYQLIESQDDPNYIRVKKNDRYAFINYGTLKSSFSGDFEYACPMLQGFSLVVDNGNWGIINDLGETILSTEFDTVFYLPLKSGMHFYTIKNDKHQLFGANGDLKLYQAYDSILITPNEVIIASNGGKNILFNNKGKYISNKPYDKIVVIRKEEVTEFPLLIEMKGKFGLLNKRGEEVVPLTYHTIRYLGKALFGVQKGKKWGVVDVQGRLISKPIFQDLGDLCDNLLPVKLDNKWGYVNKMGKMNIANIFDQALSFKNDKACVKIGEKWGVINRAGRWRVKPNADQFQLYEGQRFLIGPKGLKTNIEAI